MLANQEASGNRSRPHGGRFQYRDLRVTVSREGRSRSRLIATVGGNRRHTRLQYAGRRWMYRRTIRSEP